MIWLPSRNKAFTYFYLLTSVSQTSNTQNQANSASTSSLIRYRYHTFQISWPKTKYMAVTPNPTNHLSLKICNMEVQFIDSFTYLGSLITNDVAMYGLSHPLFRKHRISIRTNINLHRALAVSVLLYGSEAWSTMFWQRHVSNRSIHERTKQQTASSGRPFLADCQCSNPSRALKSSKSSKFQSEQYLYCQNEKICGGKTKRLVTCRSFNVVVSIRGN